jgi:uncharacterized RDD family membrane protein YckC
MTTAPWCSNCGAEQKATANFCSMCGTFLSATESGDTSSVDRAPALAAALPWTASPVTPVERVCYSCGRSWGAGRCCQYCRQVDDLPDGIRLSSPLKRLAGALLDTVIAIFTLGIGWLVWSLIVYKDGQTPGKQLLGMRCVIFATGRHAGWGRMFCREWLAKGLLFSVLLSLTFGLAGILYLWLLWDKDKQEIWDKIVDTIVVDDPAKELLT